MQTLLSILFPAFALLGSNAASARTGQDAAALLAEQRAGLGTPEALARLGNVNMRSRGKLRFEGFPAQGSFTSLVGAQGDVRSEALFEGMPPALHCKKGTLIWMTGTGGIEFKRGWSAAAEMRGFALGRGADWREVYARAELVGEALVDGRACFELRMVLKTPAELGLEVVPGEEPREPDTWWLDKDTKELVRIASDATVSGAGWQRLVSDFSDWRTVAGVRFPFQHRMVFGPPEHQLVIVLETESLEVDVPLEPDTFELDEDVRAALEKARSGDASTDPGFVLQTRKELRTATIRVQCKPHEIQQQLGTILPEVMGMLKREGLTPAGAPFARYHALGNEMDIEAGIPVAEEFTGTGRIRLSSLPGGEVVSGLHVGPYHELPRTHAALAQWLAAQELATQGGPWEIYWTDPGLERDPAKWRTEIVQPVSRKGSTTR